MDIKKHKAEFNTPKERPLKHVIKLDNLLEKTYISERDVYQDLINCLVLSTNSNAGYLHLYHEETHEIELAVWSDQVLEQCTTIHDTHYPIDDAGIWADSIRKRHYVIHNELPESYSEVLPEGHIPLFRHCSIPLMRNGVIEAIVGIGNSDTPYTDNYIASFSVKLQHGWTKVVEKVKQIKSNMDNPQHHFGNLNTEDVLIEMLGAVSKAIELRDEYTAHHQKNVSFISEQIAQELELSQKQILGLSIGALVHDIGKISIPTAILNKTGRLLSEEYQLLKIHSENGAKIFSGLSFPWPLIDIILQHHERLDGSGYPNGLKGSDICLEARIIAVADTYDAMASERPYRHSLGYTKAINVIHDNRGTKYDPYVVDAFLRCVEKDPTFNGRYNKE